MTGRVWFTGDTHFDHFDIIGFCVRPYTSVAEMNAALIANWNAVVAEEDTVWHVGDFSFGDVGVYLNQLNGTKHLIHGNHDGIEARNHLAWASSSPWAETVVEDCRLVLCHYAMRTWPGASNGGLHFFGHTHGALRENRQSCDLGVDCWDYRPVGLTDIRHYLSTLPLRGKDF